MLPFGAQVCNDTSANSDGRNGRADGEDFTSSIRDWDETGGRGGWSWVGAASDCVEEVYKWSALDKDIFAKL